MQPAQKYANYKAVAVSQQQQSKAATKAQRKGGSADPANDHSSKKQFIKSGRLDLVNQRGAD